MNDGKTMKSKKTLAIKIIMPIILTCIVAGIWIIKNYRKECANDINNSCSIGYDSIKSNIKDISEFNLHVTEKIDLNKLKSYGIPIVIDFGSDSCTACKKMAPVLEELNSDLKGKAIIKFVDVWKYEELTDDFPINLIPTQIFIDANGKPYKPKDAKKLEFKQYSSEETGEHTFTVHQGGLTKEELFSVLKEMGLK